MIRSSVRMRQIPLDAIQDAATCIRLRCGRRSSGSICRSMQPADGTEIYLKLESLQPIGSFKIRGAWNAMRKLPPKR